MPLSLYWIEPDRHPFLILVSGQLAGLALVKKDKNTWDMAEFFVVRAHRRTGIGTEAAHVVWRMFPGPWKVRVMDSNPAALEFWGRAIAAFLGSPVESERLGERWRQFSFESQRAG